MDWAPNYPNKWVYSASAAGTTISRLAVKDKLDVMPATAPNKFSFLCITSHTPQLAAAVAASNGKITAQQVYDTLPDTCIDGLNTQGLGIGLLIQSDNAGYVNATNDMDPKTAFMWIDFPGWVMSQFATIAELRDAMIDPTRPPAGTCPGGGQSINKIKLATSGPLNAVVGKDTGRDAEVHFALYDKTGAMAVIEMIDTPGNPCLYDITEQGVLANNPYYYLALENYRKWLGAGMDRIPDRFEELSLKRLMGLGAKYPDPKGNTASKPGWNYSPAFFSDLKQAAIIQALELVQVAAYAGPQGQGSNTIYTLIRDHTDADFYIRTSGSRIIRRINMARLEKALRRAPNIKVVHAELDAISPVPQYFVDATIPARRTKVPAPP